MKQFIILSLFLIGCSKPALSTNTTNNKEINVELLFIHDGVSMYRFDDGNHIVYYGVKGNYLVSTEDNYTECHPCGKSQCCSEVRTQFAGVNQ